MILDDEMKRLLLEQRLGFVATVCPDGTPSLSPKGTTTIFDDEHLVFADIISPPVYLGGAAEDEVRARWARHFAALLAAAR